VGKRASVSGDISRSSVGEGIEARKREKPGQLEQKAGSERRQESEWEPRRLRRKVKGKGMFAK
jgi:hypothetical protein